jgi:hypothetical protein
MKSFPWGLLTLVLLALDLLLTGLYLLRKRLARRLCKQALAKGKREDVELFILRARSDGLINVSEESAWRKEFGLEEECKVTLYPK